MLLGAANFLKYKFPTRCVGGCSEYYSVQQTFLNLYFQGAAQGAVLNIAGCTKL